MGRILTTGHRGSKNHAILKPAASTKGYLKTMLKLDGRIGTVTVHRIVAKEWIPNPENKPQVNHKNFDPGDNRIENLEWATNRENQDHATKAGRRKWNGVTIPPHREGSEVWNAKLNEDQVREIRLKFKPRLYTREMLAKEYGVAASTIKDAILRRWRHVK